MAINTEQLAAFAAATNNQLFDPTYRGGEWMCQAVETAETLDDYQHSAGGWCEQRGFRRGETAGCPWICWERMQPARGVPRQSLSVVDFGDVRVALWGTNLYTVV